MTKEREHAPLGGSNAYRWANCPGSVFYYRQLTEPPPSEDMLNGTAAHDIAEIVVEDFLKSRLEGTDPDIRSELTSKNTEMLSSARDFKDAIWKNILNESITNKAYGIEEKFSLDDNLGMYGYVDFFAIYIDERGRRVGVVTDYKYGHHIVPAEKNSQLAFYACALREEVKRNGKDLDYVRAVIYQPKDEDNPYKETKFTGKQLETWNKKFYKAANQIFVKKKAIFKVGDWCNFCEARRQGMCTAYLKEVEAKNSLTLLDPNTEELPLIETIPSETRVKIVLKADMIIGFVKALKADAIERLKRGEGDKGIKLVASGSRTYWKEDENLIAKVLTEQGLAWEEVVNQKLKSITDIKKALKVLGIKKSSEADEILADLTVKNPTSPKLVPDNDPRPAIEDYGSLLDE